MTISEIVKILEARVLTGEEALDTEICGACGADLMSDVMAFVRENVMLLTGLINPQVIRTAEMMDIKAIAFVRGKLPTDEMLQLASEKNIILLATRFPMFVSCGKLYQAGLTNGGTGDIHDR